MESATDGDSTTPVCDDDDKVQLDVGRTLACRAGEHSAANALLRSAEPSVNAFKLVQTTCVCNDLLFVPWHMTWELVNFPLPPLQAAGGAAADGTSSDDNRIQIAMRGPFSTKWQLQLYPFGHPRERRRRQRLVGARRQSDNARLDKFASLYVRLVEAPQQEFDSVCAKMTVDLLRAGESASSRQNELVERMQRYRVKANRFRAAEPGHGWDVLAEHSQLRSLLENSAKAPLRIVVVMLIEYPCTRLLQETHPHWDNYPHQVPWRLYARSLLDELVRSRPPPTWKFKAQANNKANSAFARTARFCKHSDPISTGRRPLPFKSPMYQPTLSIMSSQRCTARRRRRRQRQISKRFLRRQSGRHCCLPSDCT